MTPRLFLARRLLALALLLTALPAAAQVFTTTLTGSVRDTDGLPLPGATVYLSGTQQGTRVGADGRFELAGVRPGAYRLVASLVGFTAGTQNIRVNPNTRTAGPFDFRLEAVELGEVVVQAEMDERFRRRLASFTRALVGESENARQTTITNPLVLTFRDRFGALRAQTSAPLVVENRALGYRLVYDLHEFEATDTRVRYDGDERFEELEPADEAEAQRWEIARAMAYRGSLRHLLRALRAGTAEAEGFTFRTRRRNSEGMLTEYVGREVPAARIASPADSAGFYTLLFNGSAIGVRFDGEPEVPAYLTSEWHRGARSTPQPFQESDLISDSPTQSVSPSGNPEDPFGVSASGYLAFERLADLVPAEYELPTSSTRTTIQTRRPPRRGGREQ